MPDTAAEYMSGMVSGDTLTSAALHLLPLVFTTRMCIIHPGDHVVHQAMRLVRPAFIQVHASDGGKIDKPAALCCAYLQEYLSRLAELDDTKHILAACEGLGPFLAGIVRGITAGCELLSPCLKPEMTCLGLL